MGILREKLDGLSVEFESNLGELRQKVEEIAGELETLGSDVAGEVATMSTHIAEARENADSRLSSLES
ncbi:MAG: hypothetical protein KAI47_07505, partial [Deltaproteobacteria bacterium]|nr:hypothetical protein [Deltaproteobacteria bacterium]